MATTQEKQKPVPVTSKQGGRPAGDSTGINLEQRGPIDPRMPSAPPA
jgi:hypothetical protein